MATFTLAVCAMCALAAPLADPGFVGGNQGYGPNVTVEHLFYGDVCTSRNPTKDLNACLYLMLLLDTGSRRCCCICFWSNVCELWPTVKLYARRTSERDERGRFPVHGDQYAAITR